MRQDPRGIGAGFVGLFMAGLVASLTPAHAEPPIAAAALSAQSIPAGLAATNAAAETDHAIVRNVTVAKGDTLMGLLVGAGSAPADAGAAIVAIKKSFDPRKLRIGHELTLVFDDRGAGAPQLAVVNLALAKGRYLVVQREAGRYVAARAAAILVPRFDAPLTNRGGTREMTVRKGETLMKVLLRAGAAPREAAAAIDALVRHFDPRRLQVDQQLTVIFAPGDNRPRLAAVSLTLGQKGYVNAGRDGDGGFTANTAAAPIEPSEALAAAAAAEAAAPEKPAVQETTTVTLSEPEAVEPAREPTAPAMPTMPASRRDDAVEKTVIIRKGDTLMRALRRAGSDKSEANAAIAALSRHFNPRRLQVGQELTVVFIPAGRRAAPPRRREPDAGQGFAPRRRASDRWRFQFDADHRTVERSARCRDRRRRSAEASRSRVGASARRRGAHEHETQARRYADGSADARRLRSAPGA